MNGRHHGFTLIELLVSMAVIGILLSVITRWQSSTLDISARTNSFSQQVAELNDVTGYVGDKVRGASSLNTSSLSVNGSTCDLFAASVASRCLALVVPEATAGSNNINRVMFYAYRLMDRTATCCANDVTPNSWADANTKVLVEYRQQVCPTTAAPAPCTSAVMPASVSGADPNVVMDYATTDNMPTLFGAYNASGALCTASCTTNQLLLQFRTKQMVNGAVRSMPAAAPYDLRVLMRNR